MPDMMNKDDIFMPGIEDSVAMILKNYAIKTPRSPDMQSWLYIKPDQLYLNDLLIRTLGNSSDLPKYENPGKEGLYVKEPSMLEEIVESVGKSLKLDMIQKISFYFQENENLDPEEFKELNSLQTKLLYQLNHGQGIPTKDIKETLDHIRRRTAVETADINPESHIPLSNGLWNLKEKSLDNFTPDLFYTWNVNGRYIRPGIGLDEVPRFHQFLKELLREKDIPLVLDYLAYCLYPGFPNQRVLILAGLPRMGKGTLIRMIKIMLGLGVVNISMASLLNPMKNFTFAKIPEAQVIIDPEFIRMEDSRYSRFQVSWTNFLTLTGGDPLSIEEKFKPAKDGISRAKMIIASNLPLFPNNSPPAKSRMQIVQTLPIPHKKTIPELEKRIWEEEGDKIVSLLIDRLEALIERDFRFTNQQSVNEIDAMWELLTHSAEIFLDECYEEGDMDCTIPLSQLEDHYRFWCSSKGVVPESTHELARRTFRRFKRQRKQVAKRDNDGNPLMKENGKYEIEEQILVKGIRETVISSEELNVYVDPHALDNL